MHFHHVQGKSSLSPFLAVVLFNILPESLEMTMWQWCENQTLLILWSLPSYFFPYLIHITSRHKQYFNGIQFYAHSLTTLLNCNVWYLTVCYQYLIFYKTSECMYMCVWILRRIIHILSFSSEKKQNFS